MRAGTDTFLLALGHLCLSGWGSLSWSHNPLSWVVTHLKSFRGSKDNAGSDAGTGKFLWELNGGTWVLFSRFSPVFRTHVFFSSTNDSRVAGGYVRLGASLCFCCQCRPVTSGGVGSHFSFCKVLIYGCHIWDKSSRGGRQIYVQLEIKLCNLWSWCQADHVWGNICTCEHGVS